MKLETLRYCRYQLEHLFVRASMAEAGARSALIADWKQVKANQDYIAGVQFKRGRPVRKFVQKLDIAA